jgi:hypothetical protein
MVEWYIKMVEEHLEKLLHWGARLSIFLLAYRESTHGTMGLTLANLVFWRELCLPCDLQFGAPPDRE